MAQDPWADFPTVKPTAQPASRHSGPMVGARPTPKDPPAPKTTWTTEPRNGKPVQVSSEGKVESLPGETKSATEIDLEAKAEGTKKRKFTVEGIMGEARRLYNQDIKGQPLSRLGGLTEYVPFLPKNERFNAAGNNILPLIRPLVAQSAKEGDSDKEMMVFQSYVPQAGDSDITIEQKFKGLDILINEMVDGKLPSQMLAENPELINPVAGTANGVTPPDGTPGPQNGQNGLRQYYENGVLVNEEDVVGTVDGNDPAYQQFAAGVGDIVEGGINNTVGLVANPINTTLFRALGYDNYTSDIGQTARDALGLPEGNQTIGAINQAVTDGLVTGGLASLGGKSAALPGMAQNALAQYGATPVRDAVTAGTAAAAGEGARASGAGPAGQFAATLAGGFTPADGAGLVQRAASRGAKPNALAAEVMGPFERSNVPMRQADFDPAARPQRAALEKSDKGRPIIQAADEADQTAMEARLSEIGGAGRVADSPYETGAMVQGALTRHGDRTKTAARARYERAEKLSGNPAIEPTQAIGATARHVADLTAGGANTNAGEIKFLTGLGEDLSAPGGKTISQLRDLRTNLRGRLKEQGLDHGQAEARALDIMDAAAKDIEVGLKGNPRALAQYKAGDKIWRERAEFRKDITQRLVGKNGEKSAIDTATAVNLLAKKDPMRFKRLQDEFEPEEQADFVATVAANLGPNSKG